MDDTFFMKKALLLASRGRALVSPNPMTGALIVSEGEIIGKGFHACRASPHAEAAAIADARAAGERIEGADMYVTLEPCSHFWEGKRNQPCAPLIIESGIKRVIIASVDPNPYVNGRGIALLEENGIAVKTGVLGSEEKKLNEAWHHYIASGRPFVHLKAAQSIDGKIADENRNSKWISGHDSRKTVHRWRSGADAILTGIGTVIADDPLFTVRHVRGKDPDVIILDSSLRISPESRVLNSGSGRKVYVFYNPGKADREKGEHLAERFSGGGSRVIPVPAQLSPGGKISLPFVLEKAAEAGIVSILCEGGSALSSALLEENLVSRLSVFISPRVTGRGITFSDGIPGKIGGSGGAVKFDTVKKIKHDILLSGRLLCLQD